MSGRDWLSHCLQPIVSHTFNWRCLYKRNCVEAQILFTWRPWASTLHTFKMKVRPMFNNAFLKKLSMHRCIYSVMLIATNIFSWYGNVYTEKWGGHQNMKRQIISLCQVGMIHMGRYIFSLKQFGVIHMVICFVTVRGNLPSLFVSQVFGLLIVAALCVVASLAAPYGG